MRADCKLALTCNIIGSSFCGCQDSLTVMCAPCVESESEHKQESEKVSARKAFAEELSMRLRSGRGARQREPLGPATNGHDVTYAAPNILQASRPSAADV